MKNILRHYDKPPALFALQVTRRKTTVHSAEDFDRPLDRTHQMLRNVHATHACHMLYYHTVLYIRPAK